ncbi:MAG: helix-turn-helix transcriptional regulator [Thermoleophilia bacterium]
MAEVGRNIRYLREEQGLTREALARVADVPATTLTKIEQEVTDNPRIMTLRKIALALGVTVGVLLEEPKAKAS